jgi:DNA-binding XRE family transcriptional regulator
MTKLGLAEYLENNDISKNEFARILGVNSPSVRRFMKDDYDPKLSTLSKWADSLGCTVSDLLKEKAKKPKKKKS